MSILFWIAGLTSTTVLVIHREYVFAAAVLILSILLSLVALTHHRTVSFDKQTLDALNTAMSEVKAMNESLSESSTDSRRTFHGGKVAKG